MDQVFVQTPSQAPHHSSRMNLAASHFSFSTAEQRRKACLQIYVRIALQFFWMRLERNKEFNARVQFKTERPVNLEAPKFRHSVLYASGSEADAGKTKTTKTLANLSSFWCARSQLERSINMVRGNDVKLPSCNHSVGKESGTCDRCVNFRDAWPTQLPTRGTAASHKPNSKVLPIRQTPRCLLKRRCKNIDVQGACQQVMRKSRSNTKP